MIEKMIREARSQRASDIHISEGQSVYLRIDGKLIKSDWELSDEMTRNLILSLLTKTSVYKGYKRDKIEMRGDRAEMSDFPLYLNTVAGGLDRRDQTIGGFLLSSKSMLSQLSR